MKRWTEEEHPERGEEEGPTPRLTPIMEAVTEKEEDREVLTEEVQSETDREERETEVERGGRAAETKAESGGERVKIGGEEGQTKEDSAPAHLSHLIAQDLIRKATHIKTRRRRTKRRR